MLNERFRWTSYDILSLLPEDWASNILKVAQEDAKYKVLRPRSITSREADPDDQIPTYVVGGITVKEKLTWLHELYTTTFLELAQLTSNETASCATDPRYGCVLNVQRGTDMRYECHVDSNPIEGLLYVTDHPPGTGGELAVANTTDAKTVEELENDCSIVYPKSGNLIFFDARRLAHYVRPLRSPEAVRVIVAMNFYTPSCPESARPADLNSHLFGED